MARTKRVRVSGAAPATIPINTTAPNPATAANTATAAAPTALNYSQLIPRILRSFPAKCYTLSLVEIYGHIRDWKQAQGDTSVVINQSVRASLNRMKDSYSNGTPIVRRVTIGSARTGKWALSRPQDWEPLLRIPPANGQAVPAQAGPSSAAPAQTAPGQAGPSAAPAQATPAHATVPANATANIPGPSQVPVAEDVARNAQMAAIAALAALAAHEAQDNEDTTTSETETGEGSPTFSQNDQVELSSNTSAVESSSEIASSAQGGPTPSSATLSKEKQPLARTPLPGLDQRIPPAAEDRINRIMTTLDELADVTTAQILINFGSAPRQGTRH